MTRKQLKACLAEHSGALTAYAHSISGSRVDAQDLVQECLVKALSAKNPPNEETALRPWLLRVLRNTFIDGLRRNKSEQAMLAEQPDKHADYTWYGEMATINSLSVKAAYQQLSVADRDILAMIDVYGLSYREAAEVSKVPIGTIMSRISRARAQLLRKLETSNVRELKKPRRGV